MRGAPVIGSCRFCLHYGWLLYRGTCQPCDAWNRKHPLGDCVGCDRTASALSKHHCRGCWKQAAHQAGPLNTAALLQPDTRLPFQQLAIAGFKRVTPGRRQQRPIRPARPRSAQEDLRDLQVDGQLKLSYCDWLPPPRTRPRARMPVADILKVPVPAGRGWDVVHAVDAYARSHGWSEDLRARARNTLAAVFTDDPDGACLDNVSHVARFGGPAYLLASTLKELGIITAAGVDRLPGLIERRVGGLPEGMIGDVTAWITALREGTARSRPKSWKTVLEYSGRVRPALLLWAHHHEYLREITADHVTGALQDAGPGSARQNLFSAFRSLFGFLRRQGRIFSNPMTRIHLGAMRLQPILPLTEADYQRLSSHASTPFHQVVLVLTAVHAARPHILRHLQLTQIDVAGRILLLNGIHRQIDELTARVLTDWLRHRYRTWPLIANPHLLVSPATALTTGPVRASTLGNLFQATGITLDRIRMDRQLEEALHYGPDPLHLSSMFGISASTGMRYATNARQLLTTQDLVPKPDHPPDP